MFKSAIKALPPIRDLIAERDALVKASGFVPPGHFYSPVVSIPEAVRDAARLFESMPREIPGIDMREAQQLELLTEFEALYASIPFPATKTAGSRYHYDNPAYSYSDAISLHCMLRHLAPRRLIEVGSGYSSCATLDTAERFLGNALQLTLIEPYPQLVHSLLSDADRAAVQVLPQRVQDVDLAVFQALQAGDVLFIDSTHVSKTGSDVNHLLFNVLPALRSGVHVHFHDVFYPFEYPRDWVMGGRSWSEIYLLRAFLQYNAAFEIVFMNTFVQQFHAARIAERMPLCLKNSGGSIWLRKR